MDDLEHLKAHLEGKTIILGIGNNLSSDDGCGSILASRIKDKVPYLVYDAGPSPENYLGKIIEEKPDTVVMIDVVDFGATPGEFRVFDSEEIKTVNLFSTHNASLSLSINYLQNNLKLDIIVLGIQPKTLAFGDKLSPEVGKTLERLEKWFGQGD